MTRSRRRGSSRAGQPHRRTTPRRPRTPQQVLTGPLRWQGNRRCHLKGALSTARGVRRRQRCARFRSLLRRRPSPSGRRTNVIASVRPSGFPIYVVMQPACVRCRSLLRGARSLARIAPSRRSLHHAPPRRNGRRNGGRFNIVSCSESMVSASSFGAGILGTRAPGGRRADTLTELRWHQQLPTDGQSAHEASAAISEVVSARRRRQSVRVFSRALHRHSRPCVPWPPGSGSPPSARPRAGRRSSERR